MKKLFKAPAKSASSAASSSTNFNVLLLQHLKRALSPDEFIKISEKLKLKLPLRLGFDGKTREMSIEEAI